MPTDYPEGYILMATQLETAPEKQGLRVLGSPIGTPAYIKWFLDKELAEHEQACEKILSMPEKQVAGLFLRWKVGQIDFILRTTPPDQCKDFAQKYDAITTKAVAKLLNLAEISPDAASRLFVKLHEGGMGFYSAVVHSLPAYTASFATFLTTAPHKGKWKTACELAARKDVTNPPLC